MKKQFAVAAVVIGLAVLAGCGSDGDAAKPEVPTLHGVDATLIAQVDCGDDGVANVHVRYGQVDETQLVGRKPITRGVGGIETFDRRYGINPGDHDLLFTISTDPTAGKCTTTLTDDETGDVLAEKTTAGSAKLTAMFAG